MATTLVIKNADFATNKIEKVEYGDIPCTGISLDKQTASITAVDGATTIVATKTPSNTTDPLTWTSSDESVCTVTNGIVTAIGEGSAAITAICGSQSAVCTITVSFEKTYANDGLLKVEPNSERTAVYDYAAAISSGLKPITIGAHTGTFPAFGAGSTLSNGSMKELYPIPIPSGCKQIEVTSANMAPLIVYYNRNEKATHSGLYRDCAKVLDGETPAGGTPWSISGWTYGGRTFTIPENANINAYTLSFNCNSSTVHDNFSLSDVTINYIT